MMIVYPCRQWCFASSFVFKGEKVLGRMEKVTSKAEGWALVFKLWAYVFLLASPGWVETLSLLMTPQAAVCTEPSSLLRLVMRALFSQGWVLVILEYDQRQPPTNSLKSKMILLPGGRAAAHLLTWNITKDVTNSRECGKMVHFKNICGFHMRVWGPGALSSMWVKVIWEVGQSLRSFSAQIFLPFLLWLTKLNPGRILKTKTKTRSPAPYVCKCLVLLLRICVTWCKQLKSLEPSLSYLLREVDECF